MLRSVFYAAGQHFGSREFVARRRIVEVRGMRHASHYFLVIQHAAVVVAGTGYKAILSVGRLQWIHLGPPQLGKIYHFRGSRLDFTEITLLKVYATIWKGELFLNKPFDSVTLNACSLLTTMCGLISSL